MYNSQDERDEDEDEFYQNDAIDEKPRKGSRSSVDRSNPVKSQRVGKSK